MLQIKVLEQLTRALLKACGHQGQPVWQVLEKEAADRVDGEWPAKASTTSQP